MPAPRGALVIGEALVDIVRREGAPLRAHPGGSPLNVAVGLARLGVVTTLHTSIALDDHGRLISQHVEASGAALTEGSIRAGSTSVAEASIGANGAASYDFRIAWDPSVVEARGFELVHTGSIGAALEPGAALVEREIRSATGLVSFDPNVRPALLGDRASAVARVERLVALAHVVKASDEDVAWLYPGEDVSEVLTRWSEAGPRVVVITRGGEGADVMSAGGAVHIDAPSVAVVDTIGAGDSFMAGLLAHVLRNGFADVADSVRFAAACAAITVSRPGADPPRSEEVAW